MFRAAYRSSSGALIVFATSGLHTHVVTGPSQVWVGTEFPLRLDYGRSRHAYVNQRLQIQLELLMMSGIPLETCWALNERWNNKFYFKLASCWLFLLTPVLSYNTPSCVLLSCFFFVSHKIGPPDLIHPSPKPHFKPCMIFQIYFSKYSIFSIIKRYAPNVTFY